MAELVDLVLAAPASWGFLGAFIYAGPRWLACAWPARGLVGRCSLEAAISLAVGAIAAAAFARWTLGFLHQQHGDLPAVAAMIGLLANRAAPLLVDGLAGMPATILSARIGKLTQGSSPATGEGKDPK